MFKRILVPLDGSDLAEGALPAAARIARATGGSIVLFGVATTPVDADIAAAIIQVAEQSDILDGKPYGFIAMATHGRGGVQRWALGSVTERVLGATKVPLLIIRPHKGGFAQSQIQQSTSYTVQPGDTLSSIAQRAYGDGSQPYWLAIYHANQQGFMDNDPTAISQANQQGPELH